MRQRIYKDTDAVVADVPDGARIMFGGFGGAGFPNNLIQALARKGTKGITAISNNCGTHDGELGLLFKLDRIPHIFSSALRRKKSSWSWCRKEFYASACGPPPRASLVFSPRLASEPKLPPTKKSE
jgi:acyl CoA:acetate/3-ketoacid CoA transferase alpha subunit